MFRISYFPHILNFKFPAGTSRGVLYDKTSWIVKVEQDGITGIGEAGPLPGLSTDDLPDFEDHLRDCCRKLEKKDPPADGEEAENIAEEICGNNFPSVRFALETALRDWLNDGRRLIFENDFFYGKKEIPINGLIWMGDKSTMRQRMLQKLEEGYSCLKMKIGAINFEQECEILEEVRNHFGPEQITLRVDANGAFTADEVLDKLERLSTFSLHSIEQPIKAGQPEKMYSICRKSPVPVALDEELIGVPVQLEGKGLLDKIQPQYIILKPGLLGGFAVCRQWIALAEERGIGWWITSALESNIGLNAISQFTAEWDLRSPQGLGTGQLYHNNFPAPLRIVKGNLIYDVKENWNLF